MAENITLIPGSSSGPVLTEGVQRKSVVADTNIEGTLQLILKELKIMNLHLSLMTDETIHQSEVE